MKLRAILSSLVALGASACAFTPPPASFSHDLPPPESSGRNHLSASAGAVTSIGEESLGMPMFPAQLSYSRQFGDRLYAGGTQTIVNGISGPQSRLTVAYDAPGHSMPHLGAGFGWWGASATYTTMEFGVRYQRQLGPVGAYVDPVAAASAPVTASGQGYGFAMTNAGVSYRPSETFRISAGPTLGWAQPLSGRTGEYHDGEVTLTGSRGLVLGAFTAGVTASF